MQNIRKKVHKALKEKLTLRRKSDISALNEANATNTAKIKIKGIEWYVPHYTLSLEQQKIKFQQIFNKIPTELQYVKRSILMKEVSTRHFWTFELGTQTGKNVPIWIIVGFHQRDRQDSQKLNNITF